MFNGEWFAVVPDLSQVPPPMPSACFQDLQGWLSDRYCELRNTLEHGDAAFIAKLGSLLNKRSALLATSSGDDVGTGSCGHRR